MSFVNSVTREVNCKIVYVGTGLSGKTTNVQYIYENTQTDRAGKLVSLSTENERTLLKGVDGVVFVVDSAPERMDANLEAWDQFQQALIRQGYDLARIPIVIQYNKRDLLNAASREDLEKTFNLAKKPSFDAVANRGEGVMETLESISQMVMDALRGLRANP